MARWLGKTIFATTLLVGAVAGYLVNSSFYPRAVIAANYAARIACACHFIGNRALNTCTSDFEPGMGPVKLSLDEAHNRVVARYPVLATRSATYTEGYGCVLDQRG